MIRQAKPDDAAAIREIAEASYARYVPRIGRRPAPMDADVEAQIGQGVLYVYDGAKPLGYIAFWPEGGAMVLDAVGVAPEASGRGIGKALIGFCEAEAARLGLERISLYTNAKMTENLSMYPHLGYVETHRMVQDGFDRVFFEKPVQPRSTSTEPTE
ncbi:GNAT family N-acetyltransferase [Sagittula sp. MA-2]|jgi:GNAT superfamily N-acetyltransferase|uniref:GNAT family N-acetyltransferase n=1 Tax=Sagittula sp. MA-2 TaxID=3048007 RepID=UPI0024C3E285|nr:GNAT family N-acetyltransferase [Sagittula sp. MA-2]WHZ35427.1 GNAT family N-acetyltransferase [Sagittula sp. MA-2]